MQPVNSTFQGLVDNDWRFPRGRVKIYPTTKSVPSKGFNLSAFGVSPDTNMVVADWWSGLSNDAPVSSVAEGTFLDGPTIIEPSTVIAFDWGVGGVPAPIAGRSDLWAVRWYGKFYPRYTGTYRFYVDCSPFALVRILVDATYHGTGANLLTDEDSNTMDRWDPNDSDFIKTAKELYFDVALTKGVWKDIAVEFHVPQLLEPQNLPTYICVKYREPDATTNLDLWGDSGGDIVGDYPSDYQDEDSVDIKKPLSAGVVNTAAAFETGIEVSGLQGYTGRRSKGQIAEYQFEIALPASTNLNGALSGGEGTVTVDSTDGFMAVGVLNIDDDIIPYTGKGSTTFTGCTGVGAHDDNAPVSQLIGEGSGDYVEGYDPLTGQIGEVSKFRLARIEGGLYDGSSTSYWADRIWGHIYPGPTVDRDNKKAKITIRDFGRMLFQQYDRNYPDYASYSMAGYYEHFTQAAPDGISRPKCYDRWDVEKAIRDLLIKGGIDPVLLYQRDRHRATGTYAADYGQYLIQGGLVLDSKPYYGYPGNIAAAGADDKYIWAFGYGTKLWENIIEMVKNFSYQFGITPSGFVRAQPFGWPDDEFSPGDAEITFSGTWAAIANDFDVYKARYRIGTVAGTKVILAATIPYWNDAEIVLQRHDGASQKIKVKVGASYATSLIIDGATVSGTGGGGDEFAIAARGAGLTWSYYDGIDPALGVNPCVIQLANVETFSQQALEVEVVSGSIYFNAIFLYKWSNRTTTRSIGNDEMGTLQIQQEIEDQRNEVDVIGAERGQLSNIGGNIINPRNPIYAHTVSRALDLNSIYDEDAANYIGQAVPVEIFDERIYDQGRADFVAQYVLDRYRLTAAKGSTNILFDPTIETGDSISLTDEHSRMLDSTQAWVTGLSEKLDVAPNGMVSYLTIIGEVDPREPMSSMRLKPAPDITDWGSEPLVNIELHHQGKRIAGNDATAAGATITIGTSPVFTVNMWDGWYIIDQNGDAHEIASNGADTIVLTNTPDGYGDGNWCITFDPLDSEALGAPLEIRFDQVVNAKIDAYVADKNLRRIADLTVDIKDVIQTWGGGKRIFWSGIINYEFKSFKGDFYVSPFSLSDFGNRIPLILVFEISYESGGSTTALIMRTHSSGADLDSPNADILMSGAAVSYSPLGAIKIVPRLLDGGFYIEPVVSAFTTGAVLDAGRLYKYTNQGGGTYRLFVEGRGTGHADPFVANEYDNKYLINGRNGCFIQIDTTGRDASDGYLDVSATLTQLERLGLTGHYSLDHDDYTVQADNGDWPWIKIVDLPFPAHFKESDNSGQGLILTFNKPEFYVTGLDSSLFLDGFAAHGTILDMIKGKYKTLCEKELTVNYEGTPHTIDAGTEVKHAQLGDFDHNEMSDMGSDYILQSMVFQVYWSKHDPKKLYFSTGRNPDANSPTEGLFIVAEIRGGVSYRTGTGPFTLIMAPHATPKPETLVVLPSYEVHQMIKKDGTTEIAVDITGDYERDDEKKPTRLGGGYGGWRDTREVLSAEYPALSGYEIFQYINDIQMILNPTALYLDDNKGLIYFMQSLRDGATPDQVLWNFLIKLEVYDRAGRPPVNMAVSAPNILLHDNDPTPIISEGDFAGVPTFWHPGAGYTQDYSFNWWLARRQWLPRLSINRAVSLILWDKV